MGHAVGKFVQCLGIPYVKPFWEYAVFQLVIDFKFGKGVNRRNKWEDLNEIFRNAVEQGYRSREVDTLTDPEMPESIMVGRRIREEQASNGGRLEHTGAGEIPNDDSSTDDEISIREWIPGIYEYVNTRDPAGDVSREVVHKEESIDDVDALRNLKLLDNSGGVDTLPIRPPRQLLPNGESSIRDLGRLDCHESVQVSPIVPPSDQQGNDRRKRGETVYKFSWTGM